jgi:hypothetical protein
MAGGDRMFAAIDVIDLSGVRGGVDKQTRAAQLILQQATSAIEDAGKALVPKDAGMIQMMLQVLGRRRSGAGPTPAPALPPTSTLTR